MPPQPTASTPAELLAPPRRRRWLWWVGGVLLVLAALVAVALWQLDPWLRRTLEKQVAEKSHGRYQLHIGSLRTNLRRRGITLRNIQLRPVAGRAADSLPAPWLVLDVGRLHVGGIGLGAVLRHEVVPVDSLAIQTVRARVLNTPDDLDKGGPLHQQLPKRLAGIRLAHLLVDDVRVSSGPARHPTTQLRQGKLRATDILLSREGAADGRRIGYAAALEMRAAGFEALVPGHALSLGAGRFSSANRVLTLDSLRVAPRAEGRVLGAAQVALWLPQLSLNGLHTELLGRRQLRADTLRFAQPKLTFTLPTKAPPPLHEVLAPYLRHVQLGHLRVVGGWLRLRNLDLAPTVQAIDIDGDNVQVDTAGYRDAARVLYAQAWNVRTGPAEASVDAPYYRLRYQSLQLASKPGSVRLADVLLKPTMPLHTLAQRKGHQVSHITLRVPQVQATGFNFGVLTRGKGLRLQSIAFNSPRFDIRGNAKYRVNPRLSVITPEQVGQLPFRVDIRRLRVTNCNMYFRFMGKQATSVGTVQINRMNGTATNLSNDPQRMTAAHPAVLHATGYLQNRCYVQATGWLPLRGNGQHRIVGTFGPAPFRILNSITEPTRFVRFKSGQVQGIRFEAAFDKQGATGTMRARYSDLKLEFLSRKGGGENRKTLLTRAKTSLVNGIVIRDENPRKGELQPGKMDSRRNPHYSVFALWQQGLISGTLNSIGLPGKMAKSISEE
ncbi:hypothetical protein F0P96_17740 [Hymenobacter busanensis]|uniref:Uncharacterized protein n=1 Tax=Hymenobacter busanensis TaxID=2607656 RepID=A0A7L5A182_9BACT|nr:hypothetical protein [Hymenobacter busanensis]KAA9327082.1 hypothetical protein F0P96_17740 [Hymenobacter busanensis]QHJ09534.1 hypothetical protein GUY19_20560 [Hymenobacter busanensis]